MTVPERDARQRDARVEAEIAAPLRATTPTLDELGHARLASGIEAALDREDAATEARRASGGGRRWRVWISGAGIVVGVVLGAAMLSRGPRTTPRSDTPVARVLTPSSALSDRAAEPGAPVPALGPSTSLLALAGERARATIGTRVRVTLVGPGRVSVLPAARAGDVELALDGGRLLVDYDGHAGGKLRIRSPGVVTTVVGTLFAVEATGSSSRVAVARGRVRTEDAGGHVWAVDAGRSWTSADGSLVPISDELAAALVRHEGDWASGDFPPPPEGRPALGEPPLPPLHAIALIAPAVPIAPAGPVAPVAPAARAQRPIDLEALYAEAEVAMRARATARARRALKTIVDHDRNGPLGQAALIDLARLALAGGDRVEASRALARLPNPVSDPALAETAAHLRCRVALPEGGAPDRDGVNPCLPAAPAASGAR